MDLLGTAGYAYEDGTGFNDIHAIQGTLLVTAEDGSQLSLNTAKGDPSTVSISIEGAQGTTAIVEK